MESVGNQACHKSETGVPKVLYGAKTWTMRKNSGGRQLMHLRCGVGGECR